MTRETPGLYERDTSQRAYRRENGEWRSVTSHRLMANSEKREFVMKLGNRRSFHKCAERLTQHWPHKPHPARHRGECVWTYMFVCVMVYVCLYICADQDTGGVSHPPVIELAELWMNIQRGTDGGGGREKLNALRYPEKLVNTSQRQTGWQWECRTDVIKTSPSVIKAAQNPLSVMRTPVSSSDLIGLFFPKQRGILLQ